jgi:HlyD family secretion protein
MDREIDPQYRRRQLIRRFILGLIAIGAGAVVFIWGPGLIRPSVARARVRTARVETGAIEATITASGTVVPEFEGVLSSPIAARVIRILKQPGAVLGRGEPILELDTSVSVLALDKIKQQIELKRNQQAKVKLDLEETLIRLENQAQIKTLELKSAIASTARNRELNRQGLLADERMREIELVEEKARLELKQIEEQKRNSQELTRTQIEGLALEMKTLEGERDEAGRQLELATTKSDRAGVLTWVVKEEGATVQQGAVLARIADLRSFRVETSVSDVHAPRIAPGLPVNVKVNDDLFAGRVTGVNPAVTNGTLTLSVGFNSVDDKSRALLRPNLRVDVLISTERKESVLRIRKGTFANAEGVRDVFVIRGEMAVRTPVKIGLASFDHFEIISGLLEGDEVIISDMTDYQHAKEIRLK